MKHEASTCTSTRWGVIAAVALLSGCDRIAEGIAEMIIVPLLVTGGVFMAIGVVIMALAVIARRRDWAGTALVVVAWIYSLLMGALLGGALCLFGSPDIYELRPVHPVCRELIFLSYFPLVVATVTTTVAIRWTRTMLITILSVAGLLAAVYGVFAWMIYPS